MANPHLAILPLRLPFLFLYRRFSEPSTCHTAAAATLPLSILPLRQPSPCHTAAAATLPLSIPPLWRTLHLPYCRCGSPSSFYTAAMEKPSPCHIAAAATLPLSIPLLWRTLRLPYCHCGNPSSFYTAAMVNPPLAILSLRQPFLFPYRRYADLLSLTDATPTPSLMD